MISPKSGGNCQSPGLTSQLVLAILSRYNSPRCWDLKGNVSGTHKIGGRHQADGPLIQLPI